MQYHVAGFDPEAGAVSRAMAALGAAAVDPLAPRAKRPDQPAIWVALDPGLEALAEAEEAVRAGWHLVLRWSPGAPTRHAERLASLADEAGVEIGIVRPLRDHPELVRLNDSGHTSILTVAADLAPATDETVESVVADLVDACVSMVGGGGAQRVEVEHATTASDETSALAASIRFLNGALVQLVISFGTGPVRFHLVAAGGGSARRGAAIHPVPVPISAGAIGSSVTAFAHPVFRGEPAPRSLSDSIPSLRTIERVRAAMR